MKELKVDPRAVQLWDYRTVYLAVVGTEAALKKLGAQGWELVHADAMDADGDVWCVFKRPAVLA